MSEIYTLIRSRAREIVARYPEPRFYRECADAVRQSERLFRAEPMLAALELLVAEEEDLRVGHGLDHSRKVTLDAGALVILEHRAMAGRAADMHRRVLLVQCAGLLHDIRRGQPDHAEKGARRAARILARFPLSAVEVGNICAAIGNHVAFQPPRKLGTSEGQLISDALYDADKFRWGPDNFRFMLWDMVACFKPSLPEFIRRFPSGLAAVGRIRDTFRTATGRKYGPEFVDLGVAMGQEIMEMIRCDFDPDGQRPNA
jgi:hypothetical protein